jgi:hypothetical protein
MQIINAIQTNGLAASSIAFGLGLAAANIPLLVQKFVELPWVSAWIRRNPKVAKAIVAELQKDVDAIADAPAAAPAPGAPAV